MSEEAVTPNGLVQFVARPGVEGASGKINFPHEGVFIPSLDRIRSLGGLARARYKAVT